MKPNKLFEIFELNVTYVRKELCLSTKMWLPGICILQL